METMPAEQTTAEDMLEATVMQNEERLEELAKKPHNTGTSEDARFPVQLNIGTDKEPKLITVTDTPDSEKARTAQIAVQVRAAKSEAETRRYATFKLHQLNDVEAVDFIRSQVEGERDLYLEAEREGKNREAIFAVCGVPPGKKKGK